MEITTTSSFIITGAAGGIADAGARLALVDINGDTVRERAKRHDALAIEADLTDPDAAAAMVSAAQDELGRIDGLIHTTGGFATGPAEELDLEGYDRLLDLNLRSLVVAATAVLPGMLEQRSGFIAGFSAAPGWERSGGAGMSLYAAAKAGVAAYLHAVGAEVADRGITTAVVYPMGVVETEGNLEAMPDADRSTWIDPSEIARALLFAATSGPRGRLTELPIFPVRVNRRLERRRCPPRACPGRCIGTMPRRNRDAVARNMTASTGRTIATARNQKKGATPCNTSHLMTSDRSSNGKDRSCSCSTPVAMKPTAEEHIPHAKSVPETALRERVDGLVDRDSEIVVYCNNEDCSLSKKTARGLEELGYRNVIRVPAGIDGWKDAGFETVAN